MRNRRQPSSDYKSLPFIEPSIRVIAGFLLTVVGLLIYFGFNVLLMLGLLFFISLNLFQSGLTKFCLMENILRFFGFRSELDEIRELGEEAQRAAALQKSHMDTLNLLNEGILELSADATILYASDGWYRLLDGGINAGQSVGQPLINFIHDDDRPRVAELLSKVVASEQPVHRIRFRVSLDDDSEHWIGGKFLRVNHGDDEVQIRGILRDITDAYLQEKQIKHMALHDSLTGLPNRVLLDEKMEHALAYSKRNGKKLGVLFIDLDNFKQVNDIYGHKAGDNLLVSVSRIMKQRLRETDALCRWGGDEFVVVLPDMNQPADMRKVAESLTGELERELIAEGFDALVTLSVGGATYPDDADTAETLLVQADKALYFAKEQGRNNVQIYSELREHNLGYYDFDLTNRFTQAIKNGSIDVHYQPIVASADNRLAGFEALARWHDEKYGWVGPGVFVPLAENLGLISELGRLVFDKALDEFSTVSADNAGLLLSLNLSNRQLMQGDFTLWLMDLVRRHGIQPCQIKLEITESIAQLGIGRAKEILEALRVADFSISLDDFGTGYSSLSHLYDLPVQELKIDMSFVRRHDEPNGRVMLETICAMGHSLGLQLVAEGVESGECAEVMQDLGVTKLQGYFFNKPMPWREIQATYFQDDVPAAANAGHD